MSLKPWAATTRATPEKLWTEISVNGKDNEG